MKGKDKKNKLEVCIGLVQWQANYLSFSEFMEKTASFIKELSKKGANFILFPEFFSISLLDKSSTSNPEKSIRSLTQYTEHILEQCRKWAMEYQTNIITGSMPVTDGSDLYNISYLCQRDGSVDSYRKLHNTPGEVQSWNIKGGDDLPVFDTDCGRVGIQICYDVEFPEPSRLLTLKNVDILFVPYRTNTISGYNRVRFCARARAVENECYVAITGITKGLPGVENLETQYSQSAVFTPLDDDFPENGIQAEAVPNKEMSLITSVDLAQLKSLHRGGSVQNIKDRRTDLYELERK